jgi:uncharacterized protein YqgC (DUF456 family)
MPGDDGIVDGFGIFLVAIAMAIGLLGTLLPFLPGLPIVWAAALVYGLAEGFGTVGWLLFALITAVGIAGLVLGTVLPHRRASARGAPRSTILIGVVAGIIGFFVIPIVGLPIGAGIGVLLAERRRLGDWDQAWGATKDLMVGFGIGALVQFGAGAGMIVLWVAWVLLD